MCFIVSERTITWQEIHGSVDCQSDENGGKTNRNRRLTYCDNKWRKSREFDIYSRFGMRIINIWPWLCRLALPCLRWLVVSFQMWPHCRRSSRRRVVEGGIEFAGLRFDQWVGVGLTTAAAGSTAAAAAAAAAAISAAAAAAAVCMVPCLGYWCVSECVRVQVLKWRGATVWRLANRFSLKVSQPVRTRQLGNWETRWA